ncbi:MAG: cell wall-binding repeat-containing protein, partial [Candidatus Nanohaloarchaea archaeon]|nr:cell wall-binding repeat-containing protein [Candidatus Nanohaloarchaea archaeon]
MIEMDRYKVVTVTAVALMFLAALPVAVAQEDLSGDAKVINTGEIANSDVDTAILASVENYPDALVSSSAASKLGLPLLLTEKKEVEDRTVRALEKYGPDRIVLVGGTSVIGEGVEQFLRDKGYSVTRLWGATRYGTAVEVADYFWPEGADSAVIVENSPSDRNGQVLASAKELARQEKVPVFLAPSEKIPVSVILKLEDLGAGEVTFVGKELSEEAKSQLSSIGVSVNTISADTDESLSKEVKRALGKDVNSSEELKIVASADFRHSIAAAPSIASSTYHIGNTEDIGAAVEFVNEKGITRIDVVGRPGLAAEAAERLRSETEAEVEVRGFRPRNAHRFAANTSSDIAEEIKKLHVKREREWKSELDKREERLRDSANKSIKRAEERLELINASIKVERILEVAREEYNEGDYLKAVRKAQEAVLSGKDGRWKEVKKDQDRLREELEEEQESLKEAVEELKDFNREFSEEVRKSSEKEKLEVISELHTKRRKKVRETVDRAVEKGRKGGIAEKVEEARREVEREVEEETGYRVGAVPPVGT